MTDTESEAVHTVADYYDGPRAGYADYQGRPHAYECIFDEEADEYSDDFVLRPVSAEEFSAAMGLWSIWLRWRSAFDNRRADLQTHPCLPADRQRFESLEAERQRLEDASAESGFQVRGRMFLDRTKAWRVVWTKLATTA